MNESINTSRSYRLVFICRKQESSIIRSYQPAYDIFWGLIYRADKSQRHRHQWNTWYAITLSDNKPARAYINAVHTHTLTHSHTHTHTHLREWRRRYRRCHLRSERLVSPVRSVRRPSHPLSSPAMKQRCHLKKKLIYSSDIFIHFFFSVFKSIEIIDGADY